MLILFINSVIKIIRTSPYVNNDDYQISYNNRNSLYNAPLIDTSVCIEPSAIREKIIHAINLGAPIIDTINKKYPVDDKFKDTDVLETLRPHKLNGLLYSFQPSPRTLKYMNKNNVFLVIKLGLKAPIRSQLIIPKAYVLHPPQTVKTPGKFAFVDKMLVYEIKKPSLINNNHENIIYVENQPIFEISSEKDEENKDQTLVNIAECDNAAENAENIAFVYGKRHLLESYLYIGITYKKEFCDYKYLIEKCLIEDILYKVNKINCTNNKQIIKGLIKAKKVLMNQSIRRCLARCANSCKINHGCKCKNKCELQIDPIEKICPTTPIEYIKYCWKTAVNCFITGQYAIEYACDNGFLGNEFSYTTNNNTGRLQCVPIKTLQQLLAKIDKCKNIFEVRAQTSLYLSMCSFSSAEMLSEYDMLNFLGLIDCRYDFLMA